MVAPTNTLQQVITYNESNLALLLNQTCVLNNANLKYKHFNDQIQANLGDTVSFDLPPRMTTTDSLVVSFQSANQRVQNLAVDQELSVAYEFTAQQFIFNVRDYMKVYGRSAMAELGNKIETNVSGLFETNTFRFYGDGVTAINTYLQLANALAFFRNFGAAKTDTKAFLSDMAYPGIINSGLNQFVQSRNDRIAMSWELGEWDDCEWYRSNLLPVHTAGTEGSQGSTLTVVSTTTNAAGAVTAITFSGCNAASDADSVKAYDKFQFSDGVSGQTNLRFRTFIGHAISQSPVQFAATADAASTGASQVTVTINPPLQATAGADQNINTPIVAGMQCTVLPDHRCGCIMAGDPLYVAMPVLPEEVPYPTASVRDEDTGATLRTYYGSLFGQNQRGIVHDVIFGKTLVDEYAMMVALPV